MQNTHDLLVGTLSIGIPSLIIQTRPHKRSVALLCKYFKAGRQAFAHYANSIRPRFRHESEYFLCFFTQIGRG